MEQMLSMATHLSDDSIQQMADMAPAEDAAAAGQEAHHVAAVPESPEESTEGNGCGSGSSPPAVLEAAMAEGGGAQLVVVGKGKDGIQHQLSSGSGQSSLLPTAPNQPAEPALPAQAPPAVTEVVAGAEYTFSVEGPAEAAGKDNAWTVVYVWRYRKSCFKVMETFTIQDYKIKKLKRSRA